MSITRFGDDGRRGLLGIGLALVSAATFGTAGTFAGSLMATGWSPGAVVTLRIGIAALVLTVPAILTLRRHKVSLRAGLGEILAFGLVAVAGGQLTFFNAVKRLDVGVALLLEYGGILLVVGWMWLRHGHRPRRLTVIGGVAALAGLALVLDPAGGGLDPVGVLWAGLAGVALAVYFTMAGSAESRVPPLVLAWAGMAVGAVALGIAAAVGVLPFHTSTAPVTLLNRQTSWVVPIASLALVAAALAYAAGIAASRLLGAKVASFAGLTEVLFAVLIAWALLGQAPGAWQLAGGLVVLAGIALVRADEKTSGADEKEGDGLVDESVELRGGQAGEHVGAAGNLPDPRRDAVPV
ncbi:EamA family transporter [Dactylosporangium darangshiense]|uniref:EamA family transporter n=1 Tax=Dactylosporangium darangshiense TaxID=579108 RepID=UPI0031E6065F